MLRRDLFWCDVENLENALLRRIKNLQNWSADRTVLIILKNVYYYNNYYNIVFSNKADGKKKISS